MMNIKDRYLIIRKIFNVYQGINQLNFQTLEIN